MNRHWAGSSSYRGTLHGIFGLALAALASPSQAEVLPVSGMYPAASDGAVKVEVLALEPFAGHAGMRLGFALNDVLQDAVIEGEPWFHVISNVDIDARKDADATMRGYADIEVIEQQLDDKQVTKCVKKDKNKNCLKERVRYYECSELTVSLTPEIRLFAADGRTLFADRDSLSDSDYSCADDGPLPTVDSLLQPLVEKFAWRTRLALAPIHRNQQFRVLESRKNLAKPDRKRFRDAVRLTKNDVIGACIAFEELEASNPDHSSVLFNIGLCAESAGELGRAQSYYERVVANGHKTRYARQGLARLQDRSRANEQLAMRDETLSARPVLAAFQPAQTKESVLQPIAEH